MIPSNLIPTFPRRITLEISSKCNLSCRMCPRQYISGSGGFMGMALFKKVLREIEGRDVQAVVPFFRGESLLHPGFVEMMALLRKRTPAEIQLATNALLLDEEMSKKLIEVGLDFISFSIDAVKKDTFEKIRSNGDFDLAVNNVLTFLDLKKETAQSKTRTQVSATESVHNKNEIPAFIDFWKKHVDRVRIYPEHSGEGRFGKLTQPCNQKKDTARVPCQKPFTDMVIYYDGSVALCNHDWDESLHLPLGAIIDQSIEDIWHGDPYQQIREHHLDHDWGDIRPCEFCDHWLGMDEQNSPIGTLIRSPAPGLDII